MTRFIFSLLITLMTLTTYAQKDVTKFLGIPVDGTKASMIQKLKAKGFKSSYYDKDILEGQFNGTNVYVNVITNRDKVWRIAIVDAYSCDWKEIVSRYNMLLTQFRSKLDTYTQLDSADKFLTQDYDNAEFFLFDSKMKRDNCQAIFAQESEDCIMAIITPNLLSKYTQEQIDNPDFFVGLDILGEKIKYINQAKKLVHFSIFENEHDPTKYRIYMYYDNIYNQANGEDL